MAACVKACSSISRRLKLSFSQWNYLGNNCKFERNFCTEATESVITKPEKEPPKWLKEVKQLPGKPFIPLDFRHIYPEFLPDTDPSLRHPVREILEKKDMLKRRRVIEIPEFYPGSVLAVTVSDKFSPGKINRFVGICIQRRGYGLRAIFVLRNVIDHQGIEISYDMYNPAIRKIEVLKLEKRLDNELYYLRDALQEYSTFPLDMVPVLHPEGAPVPINPLKVKLKPRPWFTNWERFDLKGIEEIPPDLARKFKTPVVQPWEKYDLMKEYRATIPEEEQQEIYQDVYAQEKEMSVVFKKAKRKSIRLTQQTTKY